jgi:hypothetical protein
MNSFIDYLNYSGDHAEEQNGLQCTRFGCVNKTTHLRKNSYINHYSKVPQLDTIFLLDVDVKRILAFWFINWKIGLSINTVVINIIEWHILGVEENKRFSHYIILRRQFSKQTNSNDV